MFAPPQVWNRGMTTGPELLKLIYHKETVTSHSNSSANSSRTCAVGFMLNSNFSIPGELAGLRQPLHDFQAKVERNPTRHDPHGTF